MLPVLFSIGNISVSSFGVFLALGFLLSIFLVWRLARAWDLNEEKVLDLTLLTFVGGLIGARLYFAIGNLQFFLSSPLNLFLITKVPGFNFWGGFLGAWLVLYFFAKRFRLDFWQVADIASVGLFAGLIFSNTGCFFGGCNAGAVSNAFFAVSMEGLVGKRWPVQAAEALLLVLALTKIWSLATHFHQTGKIVSIAFIYLGIIKLMIEPFKQNHTGVVFSFILVILGVFIFYRLTKQSPLTHLKAFGRFLNKLISSPETRKEVVQMLGKSWYNRKIAAFWKLRNLKKVLRRLNVKLS